VRARRAQVGVVAVQMAQHHRAFDAGGEDTRGLPGRIDTGADLAGFEARFDDALQQALPAVHRRLGARVQARVRMVGLDRAVHDRAAAGERHLAAVVGVGVEDGQQRSQRRRGPAAPA
jgi:hypothetical protein